MISQFGTSTGWPMTPQLGSHSLGPYHKTHCVYTQTIELPYIEMSAQSVCTIVCTSLYSTNFTPNLSTYKSSIFHILINLLYVA